MIRPPAPTYAIVHDDLATVMVRDLVRGCLSDDWIARFHRAHGRAPVVKVMPPRQPSSVMINPILLQKRVEAQLINSGRVVVVSAAEFVSRVERSDQLAHARELGVPRRSLRPDFLITGHITTPAVMPHPGQAFAISLQVVDIRTNQKVWMARRSSRPARSAHTRPCSDAC